MSGYANTGIVRAECATHPTEPNEESPMAVTKLGDHVQVHYTGKLGDGTVFDSSRDRDPLEFTAGGDEVIPGVSHAVVGMQPGESKTIEIEAEKAHGRRQVGLEKRVSRNIIPEEAQVGDPLQAKVEDQTIVFWVAELDEDFAVLDINHPLAGHTLTFDIELVNLQPKKR
jgi:peptidylprolyl isomerase